MFVIKISNNSRKKNFIIKKKIGIIVSCKIIKIFNRDKCIIIVNKNWKSRKSTSIVRKSVNKFNKKRKKSILHLTQFEDGIARIDFGESDSVFDKRQKMDFSKKKKLFDEMLIEFGVFSNYLKELKSK